MAEGAANVMEVEMVDFQGGAGGRSPSRYFCHECVVEIDPKMPGFTCPRCNGGFIEELSSNLQRDREATTVAPATPNVTDQILMDLLTAQPQRSRYDDDEDDDSDDVEALRRPRGSSISSLSTSRRRLHQERSLPLHSFIETVLDSLRDDSYRRFGTDFSEPRLRRYGRDFRRSYGGLEDLFAQILTQLTASGPEPASQEQIDELPIEKIKKHHLENSLQCSICLENFIVDEEVTSLPCNHLHHKFCIIPWLQLHATCPICRLLLTTASQEPASAESSFRFTERRDHSLDPVDATRFQAPIEEPDAMPINLSVRSPWGTSPPPPTGDQDANNFIDVTAARPSQSAAVAPDIEMVNLDNNNVAMDTDFGGHSYGTGRRDPESFAASLELPAMPASTLMCLRDIEITGIESESDL